MANTPVPFSDFGGLDLVSSPDESACIDLSNVDFGDHGVLRSRPGLSKLNAVANASDFQDAQVWARPLNGAIIIASDSTHLRAYSLGGVVGNSSAGTNQTLSIASLGTGAAGPYLYIGGSNGGAIRRFDGTNFSSPAGMPNASFVAVQSPDNRLVAASTNTTTQRSRVEFSNAGDPETWDADDFVDLYPNDGEQINGVASYKNQTYVFKDGRYFLFYGNSVDAVGGTVFNFHPVDGIGAERGSVTAGPDGVYFVARDGIYLAQGVSYRKISAPLDPLFAAGLPGTGFFTTAARVVPQSAVFQRPVVWGTRVLFPLKISSSSHVTFVYYSDTGQWSMWDFNAAFPQASDTDALRPIGVLPADSSNASTPLWVYRSAGDHIYKTDSSADDDDGTTIASHYRTGFSDLGYPGREKDIDSTRMWGTGTVAVAGSRDFGSLDTATNVTLGTSPAVAAGLHNKQKTGELSSYKFSSVSGGAWTLHRYAHLLTDVRPADELHA